MLFVLAVDFSCNVVIKIFCFYVRFVAYFRYTNEATVLTCDIRRLVNELIRVIDANSGHFECPFDDKPEHM